jgi:hypothetical protein
MVESSLTDGFYGQRALYSGWRPGSDVDSEDEVSYFVVGYKGEFGADYRARWAILRDGKDGVRITEFWFYPDYSWVCEEDGFDGGGY